MAASGDKNLEAPSHIDYPEGKLHESDIMAEAYGAAGNSHHKSKQERRLILKQDLIIVLLLSGCYFFAYLDRGSIGNARIMGFQKDLHLSSNQYFDCLMMFFVGYMVFELPAALSLRLIPPPYAYGSAVILFGVFACCMSVARSYAAIMILRLLIGLGEAFVQTGYVFLSLWYMQDELATRCAFYYGSAPIAGAVSGIIAYAVDKNLDGVHGKESWEWLFLVEGVPTIGWGILVACVLPRLPEVVAKRGSWLFPGREERDLVLRRTVQARNSPDAKPVLFQVFWALKDPKTWLGALTVAAPCLDVAAFGIFLPTFVKEFGFSRLQTQLYTMIPYAFATVSLPLFAILADRVNKKALPTFCCLSISVIGFIILLASVNKTVLMVGCCFVATGSYPAIVIASSWLLNSHAGYTKRCTAWAVTQVFIQSYSIISTQIYTDAPRFFKGHGTLLALNALGAVAAGVSYWIMKRENKRRDGIAAEYAARGEVDPEKDRSFEELCDYHPLFRYAL